MLVVLLFFCACTWWFVRKWRLERLTANVPTLPGQLPFIGHAHHLIGNCESLWDFFHNVQTNAINGAGIMKVWIGPKLCVFVTDPNIGQSMLHAFDEKPYVYDFAKSWVDKGLITSDVTTWRRHRKLLNPTFNQRILDGFLEVFNAVSAQFVSKVEKEVGKNEFDISPYLFDLGIENVFQTAFGLKTLQKCSDEYKDAAAKMLETLCIRLQNILMHLPFLYYWTKTKKEEKELVKILKRMSSDVLRTKKAEINESLGKEIKKPGRSFKGFLDYLIELQSEGQLSDKEVTEEVDTMIAAGSDTTSRSLLFVLILLASHSDAQDRVHTEIQAVFEDSHCDVNKNHLSKLVYMEAVIKESLRLYTIAPIVARKVTQDYKQDGLFLPSGSIVAVMLSGINRNDSWGLDVENFNPDRWLDRSLPDLASFSFGHRACLGRNYAMMSMKTTLVHFLRRYRVSRSETEVKLKFDVMLKPVIGHNISIKERQ